MKTVLNVKVDGDVKREAQRLAKTMGIPLSTIVNAQLRQFTNERRVELAAPLVPNAKTRKVLDAALRDIREGRTDRFVGPFTNVEDAKRALRNRPRNAR